jgi:hypothetical protein
MFSFIVNRAAGQEQADVMMRAFDGPRGTAMRELSDGRRIVSHEAVITVERDADRAAVHRRLQSLDMTILGSIPSLGTYRVGLPSLETESSSIETLRRIAGIESAEWHGTAELLGYDTTPNDTWFHEQWQHGGGLGSTAAGLATQDAWAITEGSSEVIVAILDTGVDFAHIELAGRLLQGYDFVDEDNDPSTINTHGQRVTLTLAANANNSYGTAGVDHRCLILPVKVATAAAFTSFDTLQGIEYAVRSGADVMSLSFVAHGESVALEKAFMHADANGVIMVAGAGNGGQLNPNNADNTGVGSSPFTIAIGASGSMSSLAEFSSNGTAVDFVAPGVDVVTSWPLSDGVDKFILVGGTSNATPLVAGVVALMKAVHPGLTKDQAYAALRAGAIDEAGDPVMDTPGWDRFYGHGRVSAAKALDYLCQCLDDPTFSAAPASLDLEGGGTVSFRIDAGREYAGGLYLLLGTASGTNPASPIGLTRWPLVSDSYTHLSFAQANQPPWTANLGKLDDAGRATVSLAIPPMLPDVLGGLELNHAAAVWVQEGARPLHVPATLVTAPRRLQFRLPSQVVFSEDFEGGLAGWSVQSDGPAAWHLAEDGECGAKSRMAAFNEAATCSFTPGTPTESRLLSPSFTFSQDSPFTLDFDMIRDFAGGSLSTIQVEIVDETATEPLVTQKVANYQLTNGEWGTGLVHVRVRVPQSSKFEGRTVHLEFVGNSKEPAPATGWLVDNIEIRDLGALPNSSGP